MGECNFSTCCFTILFLVWGISAIIALPLYPLCFEAYDVQADIKDLDIAPHCDIQIESFDKLLIDYARDKKAACIFRGLRAVSDFDYEFQMTGMNLHLAPEIETNNVVPRVVADLVRIVDSTRQMCTTPMHMLNQGRDSICLEDKERALKWVGLIVIVWTNLLQGFGITDGLTFFVDYFNKYPPEEDWSFIRSHLTDAAEQFAKDPFLREQTDAAI